jgi:hypothetical protein
MNGLVSSRPSSSAVRLAVSGFLLLIVQSALLLLGSELGRATGNLVWFLTTLAALSFALAFIGIPEPSDTTGRPR